MNEAVRIIKKIDENNEFTTLEDGFVYYDPSTRGALSSHNLRVIADELDKRNKVWQDQINEYFYKQRATEDGQEN